MKKKVFKFSINNVISIAAAIIFSIMTIGYALYGQTLSLNGVISVAPVGVLHIKSATYVTSTSVGSHSASYTGTDMNISFTVVHNAGSNSNTTYKFSLTYDVVIQNDSLSDYIYTDFPVTANSSGSYTPKITLSITYGITNSQGQITSWATIQPGYVVESGSSVTLRVKMDFEMNGSGTVGVGGSVSTSEDTSGNFLAAINPTTGDLREENAIECFDVSITSTYKYNRFVTLTSSNDYISLVTSAGTPLGSLTIPEGSTNTYQVCAKVTAGSIFLTETTRSTILLQSNDISPITVGVLTFNVTPDVNATDDDPIEIGNVKITVADISPVVGEATISWNRIDTGGSPVTGYFILLTNEGTNSTSTYATNSAVTSYKVTGLAEGTYSAKVYGLDDAGNIGEGYCAAATTTNGYCSKSETKTLKWTFTVTYALTNLASSTPSPDVAYLNTNYETTLSISGGSNPSMPSSITVTMGGTTLSSGTHYTYSSSSGNIVIYSITGDLKITASASSFCLIEGTKIKLANGSYKNIEDIEYDDLLMVISHDTGKVTYEYPIWIEKATAVDTYQQTTFSDGTVLKTYGPHGIFSMDNYRYISVDNPNDFKVGTTIAKVNTNNEMEIVTVTKIETIKEDTHYYHVSSTWYHNIIANDLLTTDGMLAASNMFEYDQNLTWNTERDAFLATNDLFNENDWKTFFPLYIFRGFRMAEAKNIFNKGLLDIVAYSYMLNSALKIPIKNSIGNNMWMITTSDDIVIVKSNYLKEEESIYTLPNPKNNINFVGWHNTGNNKIYNPGDKIPVHYGMHFVAVYK